MKHFDRIKQQSTTTGSGSLTLSATPAGFRQFASLYTSTDQFFYVIQEPVSGQWEAGVGHVSGFLLVRDYPLEGSTTLPVAFGVGTKDCFVSHQGMLSNLIEMGVFGDGSLGDLYLSGPGTTTLTADSDYQNVSINGGAILDCAGYRLRVRNVLHLAGASVAGSIRNNGGNGTAAVANAKGLGVIAVQGSLGPGTSGGDGADGGTGAGAVAPVIPSSSVRNRMGGDGAAGGAGGSGNGGANAGGAQRSNSPGGGVLYVSLLERLIGDDGQSANAGLQLLKGGLGGAGGSAGGGDGGASGGGGGGGSGGGVLDIAAAIIKVDSSSTSNSCISADAGAGGAGGVPAAGNRGGGGGGAGGGGGYVRLVVGHVIGSSTNCISCSGASGGAGANKTGTGAVGNGGNGGNGGRIDVFKVATGTRTRTIGGTGVANVGQTGGAGANCLASL